MCRLNSRPVCAKGPACYQPVRDPDGNKLCALSTETCGLSAADSASGHALASHFQESRPEVLAGLIQRHPLGCVTTMGADGLADHIPLMLEADASSGLKLIGHVARANPIWQYPAEQRFLVVFQGRLPTSRPMVCRTKQPEGQGGAHLELCGGACAHATLQAIREPQRVLHILTKLTDQHEAAQPHPGARDRCARRVH